MGDFCDEMLRLSSCNRGIKKINNLQKQLSKKDSEIRELKDLLEDCLGWVKSYQMQTYSKAAISTIEKAEKILGEK